MRIDLFEFLEGLIRGIVYFIYNVIETTATILRHPIKGPLKLARRQEDPGIRQLSALTYLFLILIVFHWWGLRGELEGKWVVEAITSTPKLDTEVMWPEILAALFTTVVIDAVLRLILRWRLPGRPRLRQTLLSMAEFAMLWMVIAFLSSSVLTEALIAARLNQTGAMQWAMDWTLVAVTAPSYFPATILLGAGTPLARRIGKRKRKLAGAMMGVIVLFWAAVWAGANLGHKVLTSRDPQYEPARLETLRCELLPDGRVSADSLIHVSGGEVVSVEPNDLTVVVWGGPDGPVDWRHGDPRRFLVIEPGHVGHVEVISRERLVLPENKCHLNWSEARRMRSWDKAVGIESLGKPTSRTVPVN